MSISLMMMDDAVIPSITIFSYEPAPPIMWIICARIQEV